jgi:DNA invertase Pin-like site-specific DNA recombinase
MNNPVSVPAAGKIRPHHLDRLAVVYVRQSTPKQVLDNRESADRQYQLAGRATALGWRPDRVLVIDDDLGVGGPTAADRAGFQRLLAEVGLNHVGLILGSETSRLARSCKDWYQLLELAAVFGVLIADHDGLYDPGQHADRMLLGLSVIMSEAELHVMRNRLDQGKRNKAARGELFSSAPIDYVRGLSGEMMLDPDQQVQGVVRLRGRLPLAGAGLDHPDQACRRLHERRQELAQGARRLEGLAPRDRQAPARAILAPEERPTR